MEGVIKATDKKRYDLEEIQRAISTLFQPDAVVEVRMINKKKRITVSGWFDDHKVMAKAVAKLARDGFGEGYRHVQENIYWTLNPVNPALLARQAKNTFEQAEANSGDADILCRRWLPVDIDPDRPTGISSTAEELKLAEEVLNTVLETLGKLGFDDSNVLIALSGNGYHLLIRIDLPNDAESLALVKECLAALDHVAGTEKIKIDQKVGNAARILKAYGTLSVKGVDTPDRPWRMSRLLRVPNIVTPCSRELLQKLAILAPKSPNAKAQGAGTGSGAVDSGIRREIHGVDAVERWKSG
jgi:hypothetical protein